MYNSLTDHLDKVARNTTIRKTKKKTVKKNLDTAVDSLLDETKKESTAISPTEKQVTEKVDSIPDLSDMKRIKKTVIIEKPDVPVPQKKKSNDVVWL